MVAESIYNEYDEVAKGLGGGDRPDKFTFDSIGDSITGIVQHGRFVWKSSLGKLRDDEQDSKTPELHLMLDDGTVRSVLCGSYDLKNLVAAAPADGGLRPVVGERIRMEFTGVKRVDKGTQKFFGAIVVGRDGQVRASSPEYLARITGQAPPQPVAPNLMAPVPQAPPAPPVAPAPAPVAQAPAFVPPPIASPAQAPSAPPARSII